MGSGGGPSAASPPAAMAAARAARASGDDASGFGGVAGSAFWLAILPIDLAKTRYQIASPGAADDVGVWRLLARETSRTGARGLWAGLGPVLARAFPANAVQFLAWEGACQLAGVRREHGR